MLAAFEIEKRIEDLNRTLPKTFGKARVFLLSDFYSHLFSLNNHNLIEAYSTQYIELYIESLEKYTPFYQPIEDSENLIKVIERLKEIRFLEEYRSTLNEFLSRIIDERELLRRILKGEKVVSSNEKRLSVPLIEKCNGCHYAVVESLKIRISKSRDKDSFLIIPMNQEVEKHLNEQIKTSFESAKRFVGKYYKKVAKYHEVIIYFDNLCAFYEGNSLGIALTTGFIEQLSLLYNLPYVTNIADNIVFTGGMDKDGKITPVTPEIIEKKTEAVFYSNVKTFIVPKEDEIFALEKVKALKMKHPKRQLAVSGIENFNEILNRRDLIHYKKQSVALRTVKGIRNNWILLTTVVILLSVVSFFIIRDIDNNPATSEVKGNVLLL